jgi:hypothetical protein
MRKYVLGAALVVTAGLGLGGLAFGHAGAVPEGRMTGGGNFDCGNLEVTYGFEVHCDASIVPNTFEINWNGNHFHMDTLTSAECIDDPNISPNPPVAPFDTFFGQGTGSFNNVPGGTIFFNLTDAGEPGTSDTISVTIFDANQNLVLNCNTALLEGGNNQAHVQTPTP